jgi:predicted Zn-dependent protease
MKKVKILALVIVMTLSLHTSVSYADTDDVFPFTWGVDTTDFSVQAFTTTFTDKIQTHSYDWNGIDNNIFVSSTTWNIYMDDEGCDIKFYETDLPGTTIGRTKFYNKSLGIYWEVSYSYTGSIEQSRIYLDNASGGLGDLSDEWQVKTIVHEIGHALALAHPDCGSDALMQQGQSSPAKSTIQTHDEDNLKNKW